MRGRGRGGGSGGGRGVVSAAAFKARRGFSSSGFAGSDEAV